MKISRRIRMLDSLHLASEEAGESEADHAPSCTTTLEGTMNTLRREALKVKRQVLM